MYGLNWLSRLLTEWNANGSGGDGMTADRAVTYSAVKYCVDKISSHIGQLPLNLHKITKDRNEKDTRHAAYRLLRVRPNGYQTPYYFKKQMMAHALLWGNARAYYDRKSQELIPMMPDRCESVMMMGEKFHVYKVDRDERLSLIDDVMQAIKEAEADGMPADVAVIPDSEVVHIPGLGFDGIQGKSVIQMARQSWGIGLGYETTERNRQKRGYNGGLMLQAPPGALRQKGQAEEFLSEFRRAHQGETGDVIGLLREGITANVMTMSNTDAQFIESRRFNVEEVMRWFAMPTMPGDNASVSYNSLEQKNLAYRIDCLGPWLTTWEEECEAKLLTPAEVRNGYYFKFNDGAILRTDKQTTSQIASTLISARVINPNEAREWFELNPYEGGELFENPAVSPGQPGSSDQPDNPSAPNSEGEPDAAMANRAAQLEAIEHMIGVESNRCIQNCRSENFVDKTERFYAKWEQTLAAKLESLYIDRQFATDHCEESRERLMACADQATDRDQLTKLVRAEVDGWKSRALVMVNEAEVIQC